MSQIAWKGTCSKCGRAARLNFVPRNEKNVLCSDCHHQRSHKRGLPEGYLQLGYFDDEGNLRKEVLIDEARAVAKVLADENLSAVKLNRLYNRARMLKDRLNKPGSFPSIRVEIYDLRIDAMTSTASGVTPEVFLKFVECNVELAVVDQKSFIEGFVRHLRSVRAWYALAKA
jgi:CxxC-x17-CxxC domain-containing protein